MGKRRMRKRYEASFKARVALAALQGDKTLSELASEFGVHGNLISQWKRRLVANIARVFEEPEDGARQDHQADMGAAGLQLKRRPAHAALHPVRQDSLMRDMQAARGAAHRANPLARPGVGQLIPRNH